MKTYRFPVGPFTYSVSSEIPLVHEVVEFLYADYPRLPADAWLDFEVRVSPISWFHRFQKKPMGKVFLGDFVPFPIFELEISGAMLEWGMNWCVWMNVAHLLIFHAAMLERNGHGLILAADSGEGKSTLAAGLALSGWRLLSDELTLLDPKDTWAAEGESAYRVPRMVPIPRPICLKNESISVVRHMFPEAPMTKSYMETGKGVVAHVRPPADAVRRMRERVLPRWIVFPKYTPGADPTWTPWEKAEAFIQLGQHGDAYSVIGGAGFESLAGVISHCDCWRFEYGSLADAIQEFENFTETQS